MADIPKIPKQLTGHGDIRIDDYFWMNERDSKPVLQYLRGENRRAKQALKSTERLQKKLVKEMRSRIKEEMTSVPVWRSPYLYYYRFKKGGEYPIFARRKGKWTAKEEILIDGNRLAKGKGFFQIGTLETSIDQRLLCYGVDTVGRRFFDLYFKDTATGKTLPDSIEKTTGEVEWANDNKTVFYVQQHPETLRAYRLFRYEVGGGGSPELIFEESDETYQLSLHKGRSDRWLFLTVEKRDSSEVYFLDANRPRGQWTLFQPRHADFEYGLEDGGDEFLVVTNWDAPNYRVFRAPPAPTVPEKWREWVPHDRDVFIDGIQVYQTHVVVQERFNGLSRLKVVERATGKNRLLEFPDPTYVVDAFGLPEYDSKVFRFVYNSLNRPTTTFEEGFTTQRRKTLKIQDVPGFDRKKYRSLRLWARAEDGTKIPISLLSRKGAKNNGKNPLLLEGYGSYGISNDPSFHRNVFSLVDRGFIYAIAHIRGGGEMGREWYEQGRLRQKKNTFSDFIACSEYLIAEKFTSSGHLYINGGSAGGLLIGVVLNWRPDLFNGAIAAVPFVDVVTTMLDETLPLTTAEYREWGDPRIKADYDYMKSYSPYDNVTGQSYPNLLVTTGYHDSQVQYFEPAKWVAKLRERKTDDRLLLLYTEMAAGHSGSAGRFEALKTVALDYAFYLQLEGIKK